jgi:preprotein translocase subunit SecF
MHILENTHIDFLSKRKIFYIISVSVIVTGMIVFFLKGITLGIDFAGGTEVLVRFQNNVSIEEVRAVVTNAGINGAEIKTMGFDRDILIRTSDQAEGSATSDKIRESLKNNLQNNSFEVLRIDKVGPKIGKELRVSAIYATIVSIIAVLIYLAFRFEFVFAMGTVLGIFHDVFMTLSIIALASALFPSLNLELNQGMVAAFLTLVGFSTNDKVVIFDRVRELAKIYKGDDILILLNKSINSTLSRTVITTGTVFLVILILLIFGGEVNRSFAFTFTIGILTSVYSSVYVANAFVVDIRHIYQRKNLSGHSKTAVSKA